MNVLMAHNYYQQPGGEDQSFAAEADLLEAHDHSVTRYTVHNNQVDGMNSLALAQKTFWNKDSYRKLVSVFRKDAYQIGHFQNTFPLISPAAYYAAHNTGVPVVQSLRNYRFSCVNGLFFRDGKVCEDCLGKTAPLPGIIHSCYRDSRAASAVVAGMLAFHKLRRTYSDMVDVYIALTEFSRQKFVEAGLRAEKIMVKPNFVAPDPGVGGGQGGYALFVGRLSQEKGLGTLLNAWNALGERLPLKIVGDGPLAEQVRRDRAPGVEWLGRKPSDEVYQLMGEATVVIVPSEWYETFGRVVIEAFAKGTPVIVANIGAIAELVENKRTGLHFEPGNAIDLGKQVEWLLAHPAELAEMRKAARAEYEAKYTAERNYELLMQIYERAIESAK